MLGSSNLRSDALLVVRFFLAALAAAFAIVGTAEASTDPPFPLTESFASSTAPGWTLGGSATLTAPGTDTAGNGWLRLTGATTNQAGYAFYDTAFPSAKGASVEFDYATYGGTGADGLTFFLYDGATTAAQFQIGAFGGSLGYAPCSTGSKPGLNNAYIGVGFDEFGNFTNLQSTCGTAGPVAGAPTDNTARPNFVAVRGSEANNYPLLAGAATSQALTATRANARHVSISVLPDGKLNVFIRYPDGTFQQIVNNKQLPTSPATLKLGFAGSTGGSTNIHEIHNTKVVKPVDIQTTVTDGGAGKPRAGANTWTAVVTNAGTNDTNSGTFAATTGAQSLTGVTWTCSASAGSSCGAATSGSGLPSVTTGALLPSGTLTFQITGTPAAATDYAQLSVDAQPTGDTGDTTPDNNAATDTSDLTPVFDAQPTFTLASNGLATATTTNARGGNVTYASRWQRCDPNGSNCVDIASATATTYTTTAADRGFTIRYTRTATNAAGSTVSASAHYSPLPTTNLVSAPSGATTSTSAAPTFSTPTSGATLECKLDAGAWATCTSPRSYTGLAEGSHTFSVRAVYGGLSDDTPATATWTVDTTVPNTSITSQPAANESSTSASLGFTGTDPGGSGVASYQCRIDAGAWGACTSPRTYTGLAQGNHTFDVRAIDNAGNVDPTPASYTWRVDTVDPDTSLLTTPPSTTAATTGAFTFTGTDPSGSGIASYECRLDGGSWVVCTSPESFAGLADGSHTVDVRAIDTAGNRDATPASYTWTVDATAPNTTIQTHPPTTDDSPDASFTFTGSDGSGSGVASYECQLDGGAWNPCTSPKDFTGLADGSHTFAVRAIDGAGTADATPDTFTWTVDTAAPATSLTGTPPAISGSSAATLTFTGTDPGGSGVSSFACRLDGGSWTPCTSPQSYAGLADGTHTAEVRAIDGAGNPDGSPASYTWTIDTTSPETTITAQPASTTASDTAAFSFTGSDPGGSGVASYECQLDGGSWTACTSPRNLTGLDDGDHTFRVRAIDAAGNTDATPASYSWTVDTGAPTTTLTGNPPAVSASANPSFTFTGADPGGSGVASYECRLDGGAWNPCASPKDFTGLADGSHTFEVRAIDTTGTVDPTPATYLWTIDTAGPPVTPEPPAKPTANPRPELTFTTEPGATIEIKIDGVIVGTATAGPDGTATFTPPVDLTDGPHNIVVVGIDDLGNRGPESSPVVLRVAATPPLRPTIPSSPAPVSSDGNPIFTLDGDENSTFECQLDGGAWAPCPATVTLPNLPDGTHTLKVREVNEAGVPGAERDYTWTVDTTKPALPVYVVAPPAKTPEAAARFDLNTEPGTTLRCSVDGGEFVDCTTGLDLSSLTEGTHKIVAIATDAAGNSSAPATYDWLIATPLTATTSFAKLTARLATKTIIHANKRMTIICRLSKGSTVQTCDGKAYARLKGKLVLVATGKRTLKKTGSLSAGVRVKLNKVGMAALKRNPGGLKVSVKMISKTREGRTLTTRVNTKIYPARKAAHPILSPVDSASAFAPGGKQRSQIKALAKNIKGAKSVLCVGHTDKFGTQAQGLARAKAACAELKKLGVDAKYTTQSKGSTAPRATNKTAAGRALNRRVVLLVRFP